MPTPCNCNDQYQHPCAQTPCITVENCDCPTKLQTKCVTFEGDDLPITGIKKNTIETTMWQQLDAYLGKLKTDLLNGMNLVNLGTVGARIYRGIDLLGRKEVRRINKTGNLITVTENTDDITIGLDETALSAIINTNEKTTTISNLAGTGAKVYNESPSVTGNITDFRLRRIQKQDLSVGANIIASVTETVNDININVKPIVTSNLLIIDNLTNIGISAKEIVSNNLLITNTATQTTINTKDIVSDTLVVTSTPTQIKIDTPQLGAIPALYVNNSYPPIYTEWLSAGGNMDSNFVYKGMGTLAKPFTDGIRFTSPTTSVKIVNTAIQNALNSYVGLGGRGFTVGSTLPEKLGQQVIIQSSSQEYVFNGDFNYFGIRVKLEEGAFVKHTAINSDWLFDFDLFGDNIYFYPDFIVEKNARLIIQKNGFRNRGSNFNGTSFTNSKVVRIQGEGSIRQTHISTTDSNIYTIIESNFLNLPGFVNDLNSTFDIKNITLYTITQTLIKVGSALTGGQVNGEGRILDFKNVRFNYGDIGQNTPPTARPIKIGGTCYTRFENCDFYVFSNQVIASIFDLNHNCQVNLNSPLFNGTISNLFHSESLTQKPGLTCINSRVLDGIYIGESIGTPNRFIFTTNLSVGKWDTIYFNNNFINRGVINYDKIDLVTSNLIGTINYIGNEGFSRQVVLNLPKLTSSNAVTFLGKGSMYLDFTTGALSVVTN